MKQGCLTYPTLIDFDMKGWIPNLPDFERKQWIANPTPRLLSCARVHRHLFEEAKHISHISGSVKGPLKKGKSWMMPWCAYISIHQKHGSNVQKLASSTGAWARGTTSPRPQTAHVPSDQTQWQLWKREALPPTRPNANWQRFGELFHLTQFVDPLSHCAGKGSLRRHFGLPESQTVSESQTFPSLKQVALQGSMPREHEAMEDAEPPDLLPTETWNVQCNIPCNANSSANPQILELQICKVPPRHTSSQQSSTAARLSAAPSAQRAPLSTSLARISSTKCLPKKLVWFWGILRGRSPTHQRLTNASLPFVIQHNTTPLSTDQTAQATTVDCHISWQWEHKTFAKSCQILHDVTWPKRWPWSEQQHSPYPRHVFRPWWPYLQPPTGGLRLAAMACIS